VSARAGIEDCVAMDECGEWVAYADELGRSGAMAACARTHREWYGSTWGETFEHFRVRRGYLRPDVSRGEDGWWLMTVAEDPQSVPVWIVGTKGWWRRAA
jgi:hypothetical protein